MGPPPATDRAKRRQQACGVCIEPRNGQVAVAEAVHGAEGNTARRAQGERRADRRGRRPDHARKETVGTCEAPSRAPPGQRRGGRPRDDRRRPSGRGGVADRGVVPQMAAKATSRSEGRPRPSDIPGEARQDRTQGRSRLTSRLQRVKEAAMRSHRTRVGGGGTDTASDGYRRKSRMRESRTSGSVRGAAGDRRPYSTGQDEAVIESIASRNASL